jgi:serine protease AprX
MATPVVAGAAVFLIDKNSGLTPDQVKAKLMKTAWNGFPSKTTAYDPGSGKSYTANHDAFTIGAGQVDLWAAYNNTDSPGGALGHAASGDTAAFATSLIWGDNISGSSLIWGDSVVWDSSSMGGFSLIWGDSSDSPLSLPAGESVKIAIQGEQ